PPTVAVCPYTTLFRSHISGPRLSGTGSQRRVLLEVLTVEERRGSQRAVVPVKAVEIERLLLIKLRGEGQQQLHSVVLHLQMVQRSEEHTSELQSRFDL